MAYCFLLKLSEKPTRKRINMSFRSIMLSMTDVFMHKVKIDTFDPNLEST